MRFLTNEELMDDLEGYYDRLADAKAHLAELPQDAKTMREKKRLERKRRILKDEIRHVENLVSIATEALEV